MFVWSAQQAELFAFQSIVWLNSVFGCSTLTKSRIELKLRADVQRHFSSSRMHGDFSFQWHMCLQRNNKGGDDTGVAMHTERIKRSVHWLIKSHRIMTTDRVERLEWIRDDTCRREDREREKSSSWSREGNSLSICLLIPFSLSRFLSSH